jgi:ribokinase
VGNLLNLEVSMQSRVPVVTVVGSFMMDLVIKAERRPQRGETLVGQSFGIFPGGKGFNQAVAARRLGAQVHMVGMLGQDDFGRRFQAVMEGEGIDARYVGLDASAHTGVGSPVIDAQGDNSIIIVPGANMRITAQDVENAREAISGSDILLLQLEIPTEAVLRAAQIAHAAGVPVLLNPAPARPLPAELFRLVSVLTPNETEAEMLSGLPVQDDRSAALAARALLQSGAAAVALTLGRRGALLADGAGFRRVPAYPVAVVDATAAGDAFCAGLAFQIAQGQTLETAARFANAVGGLACMVLGAEPAMPRAQVVADFCAVHPGPEVYPVGLE